MLNGCTAGDYGGDRVQKHGIIKVGRYRPGKDAGVLRRSITINLNWSFKRRSNDAQRKTQLIGYRGRRQANSIRTA